MKKRKPFVVLGVKVPVFWFCPAEQPEYAHLAGFCTSAPMSLNLNKDLPAEHVALTEAHELVHAVLFRSGLSQVISAELQEIICENVGVAISENFKRK